MSIRADATVCSRSPSIIGATTLPPSAAQRYSAVSSLQQARPRFSVARGSGARNLSSPFTAPRRERDHKPRSSRQYRRPPPHGEATTAEDRLRLNRRRARGRARLERNTCDPSLIHPRLSMAATTPVTRRAPLDPLPVLHLRGEFVLLERPSSRQFLMDASDRGASCLICSSTLGARPSSAI